MSRKLFIIGLILMTAGMLQVLAACSSATTSPTAAPSQAAQIPSSGGSGQVASTPEAGGAPTNAASGPGQGDPAAGANVFERNCAVCHGVNAEGNIGPALRNNKFVAGDINAVYTVVSGGMGKMPAWLQANGGPLNSTQINNAIAYIRTLQGVAAMPTSTPIPTDTPEPPTNATPAPGEAAKPSNEGGPGPAASLTGNADAGKPLFGMYCATCHGPQGRIGVPNLGTDDLSVPPLNPVDPTISNADVKTFIQNVDLFVEHGSVPSGSEPETMMPAFGDLKLLTPQQIADIIAYIVSLNPVSK